MTATQTRIQTSSLVDTVLALAVTKGEAPEDITPDTPFEDMDFDSLILVELAVALSNTFHVEVTDDELREAGTVAAAAALLADKGVQTA
jgi:acyl carrier protein